MLKKWSRALHQPIFLFKQSCKIYYHYLLLFLTCSSINDIKLETNWNMITKLKFLVYQCNFKMKRDIVYTSLEKVFLEGFWLPHCHWMFLIIWSPELEQQTVVIVMFWQRWVGFYRDQSILCKTAPKVSKQGSSLIVSHF